MKNAAKLISNRLPKLMQSFDALLNREVVVGVPADDSARPKDEDEGEVNNAVLAYVHENGSPAANIPPRPFMAPGINDAKEKIAHHLEVAAKRVLTGDPTFVNKGLTAAGLVAQSAMRKRINAGPPPPLKESTLASRRRRGRTGSKPLIDTGQLRNSINFAVRKKK